MKVFVTGATGAIGTQLVPQLVARGHEVVGMTRRRTSRDAVRALGAQPVVADALDEEAVVARRHGRRAGDRRAPGDRAARRDEHAPRRSLFRGDEPPAHRGDRPPARGRPGCRGAALRRPELRRVAVRAHGRAGQERGRPARSGPAGRAARPARAIRHLEEAVTAIGGPKGSSFATAPSTGPGTGISADPTPR